MRNITQHKILNFVLLIFISLAIAGFLISFIFTPSFVEKYIDEDHRIGEHVKTRITLFQEQMFYIAIFSTFITFLLYFFKKSIHKFLQKYPDFLTNTIFLLILLLVFFLLGEVVMRVFFSETVYKEYAHGPGEAKFLKGIEYNSLGYRDIEHKLEKSNDVYRILFLGDSFTFGSSIEKPEDTYPKVIEKMLNEENIRVETIVLAKRGYSTLDELKDFKEIGLKFKPDLVVIGYYINDAEGEGSRIGYEDLSYSHYIIPYELGDILYRYSLFYYFLESRLKNVITNLGIGNDDADYTKHLYSDSNPYLEQHKEDIKELITIAKDNKIHVLVVMIPYFNNFEDYSYTDIHSFVKNISEYNGAYYIDLLPYFKEYKSEEIRASFMDAHMNKLGHKVTADVIIRYLKEKTILD